MKLHRAASRLALVATLLGLVILPARLTGQAPVSASRADSLAVADALRGFLTAFENLEWESFRAAFSDSATIFHPAPEMAELVTGPRGIDSTFRAVFADIRAHASGGPPYHRLVPLNLHIQPLSPGIVFVTFQLRNTERLARRTVIFRHETAGWRIVHLHASNIAAKP